jgi:hypothetical protein
MALLEGWSTNKTPESVVSYVSHARLWRLSGGLSRTAGRSGFVDGAQLESETVSSAMFVSSPTLGMGTDSDGLWSLVVAN